MSRQFKTCVMLAVVLLQITILPHFKPFGVIPDYTFVFVLAIAIICEDAESVVFAAVSGFLLDLLTGAPIGVNTMLYMYISIGAVAISEKIYNKRLRVMLPVCFFASFIYQLLFGILSMLLRRASFYPGQILEVVLPVAAVNSIIFMPIFVILSKLRFEKRRKGIKYEQ